MEYVRLAENLHFTVKAVRNFFFRAWDDSKGEKGGYVVANEKPRDSELTWSKMWKIDTEKGELSVSNSQLASMLVAVFNAQNNPLHGKMFEVKTNNKTGKDIRYFFNELDAYKEAPKPQQSHYENADEIPV